MPAPGLTAGLLAIVGPLATAAWPTDARADEPPAIAPFSAHYSADWKSMSVGTSDLDLKQNAADGTYEYTWRITARGVFRIVYSDDVIRPRSNPLVAHDGLAVLRGNLAHSSALSVLNPRLLLKRRIDFQEAVINRLGIFVEQNFNGTKPFVHRFEQ